MNKINDVLISQLAYGLPHKEYSFCDGRITVKAHHNSGGLDHIEYHGNQPLEWSCVIDGNPITF